MKNLILALALGALTFSTSSSALADPVRGQHRRYDDDLRVLDSQRVRRERGRVELDLTPGLRRDGLMLVIDGSLAIRKVQFVYDDGEVTSLSSRKLARMPNENGRITIQVGRPPGLRHVRVWYALPQNERSARVQLVSFGDGYTDDNDPRDVREPQHAHR
jgi:hypothetical protein